MQRQRPASSGYGCVAPKEDEKTSSETKKEPKYNYSGTAIGGLMQTTATMVVEAERVEESWSNYLGSSITTMKITESTAATTTKKDESLSSSGEDAVQKDKNKNVLQVRQKDVEFGKQIPKKEENLLKLREEDIEFQQPAPKQVENVLKLRAEDVKFVRESDPEYDPNDPDSDCSKKVPKADVKSVKDSDPDHPSGYPKKVPVVEPLPNPQAYQMVRTAVPRTPRPLPPPKPLGRPLVLATHLVPSLPIGLFEVLVEAIEDATGRAVVILYEARTDRPVCTEVADISILPAGDKWESGTLLPVSFVFEHHLNKSFSPAVYADVVVATDRAPHVETLMDLRGHRCALPDRKRNIGATTLLFNYLRSKGEGPAFFGNTLDANSQVSALQMVAGKQVEVCVLESPVIKFHRQSLPGVYSLHILSSLGPLPPYPIMVNNNLAPEIVGKIKDYLLRIRHDTVWLEKFAPYSVLGFAEYNKSLFDVQETKPVRTSAPYY